MRALPGTATECTELVTCVLRDRDCSGEIETVSTSKEQPGRTAAMILNTAVAGRKESELAGSSQGGRLLGKLTNDYPYIKGEYPLCCRILAVRLTTLSPCAANSARLASPDNPIFNSKSRIYRTVRSYAPEIFTFTPATNPSPSRLPRFHFVSTGNLPATATVADRVLGFGTWVRAW